MSEVLQLVGNPVACMAADGTRRLQLSAVPTKTEIANIEFDV
jgi:hypothetical protein